MALKTVLLVCNTGMSSTFFVSKMQETIKDKGLDITLSAVSASEVEGKLKTKQVDVVLLSPQVRYLKPQFDKHVEGKETLIGIIDNSDYASMNAEKIIDELM